MQDPTNFPDARIVSNAHCNQREKPWRNHDETCGSASVAAVAPGAVRTLQRLRPVRRPAAVLDNHLIRLEEETKDGRYEVRAELPGLDPANDIDTTVRDGQLTIKA